MVYQVWDVSRAQNYRFGLRDTVKNKRKEIKNTTSNKDIQKVLFNEFMKTERSSATYQKSSDVLKWTHDFEKVNWPIDKRNLVLKNIKWVWEDRTNQKWWFDIANYMQAFESDKSYIFTKEDFEEITNHFLHALEKCLFKIKNLLKQRQDEESESCKAAFLDPNLGQELMSKYLYDPEVVWLIISLDLFFNWTLGCKYSNNFSCKREDLQEIFRKNSRRFMELLSLVGDINGFEEIKNNEFSETRDCNFYSNLKKINILKGDVYHAFVAASASWTRSRLELSSVELQSLALNKKREEAKDALMWKIHSIVYDINDVAWKEIHDVHDYSIRSVNSNYGKIGRRLMELPLSDIEKKYLSFQNELAELQGKRKNGVSEILSLLQNKPESVAKTSKTSMDSKTSKKKKA